MSSAALPGGWLSIAAPPDPPCGTRGSSTDGKVIVVDKGDGGLLGLDGRQEWHFPPTRGASPERLFAAGSGGSADAAWMRPGRTYTFRLDAGRERRQLLAAISVMYKEGASVTAITKPVSPGAILSTTTI